MHEPRCMDNSTYQLYEYMKQKDKNIIIAGVNKSGTTSLFMYLSAHPEICPSRVKETQYFLPIRYGVEELPPIAEYWAQFSDYENTKYFLEATPGYYYGGRKLAERIKEELGSVRIILSFRDPIDRMFSFFKFKKSMLELDKFLTFDEYIKLCESIPPDQRVKRENNPYWGIEGGYYSNYLSDWIDVFGKDKVKIIFFEDMKKDPKSVLRVLCDWLSIESEMFLSNLDISIENRTVNYRIRALQRFALILNWQFEHFWRSHPRLKRRLRQLYYRFNGAPNEDVISPEVYQYLEQHFKPYNRRLAFQLTYLGYLHLPDWLGKELDYKMLAKTQSVINVDSKL